MEYQNNRLCMAGCGLAVMAVYTAALYCSFQMTDWWEYLMQTCMMLLAGILLVWGCRRMQAEILDVWVVLTVSGAVGLAAWSLSMAFQSWQIILQQLILAFWPLLLIPWARFWKSWPASFLPELPYYGSVAMMFWLLLDILMPVRWIKWDILTLVDLMVTAFLVWNEDMAGRGGQVERTDRIRKWIPMGIFFTACCLFHQRAGDILVMLSHPLSASDGGIWEVNWLAHRFRLMAECWQGEYGMLLPGYADRLAESSPLLWIRGSLGIWAVLAVGVAQILMVWLLNRQKGNTPWNLTRVLVSAVTVQTVLGLTAEIMVNTSTLLGMPFFRSPAGCLLLPLAVMDPSRPRAGRKKGMRKVEINQSKSALRAKNLIRSN